MSLPRPASAFEGAPVVAPEAASLLEKAGFAEPLELELHLQPSSEVESLGLTSTSTFERDADGKLRFTLNGRSVTPSELDRHAAAVKQGLMQRAGVRLQKEEAWRAALIRKAGLEGKVVAAAGRVVQVRASRDEVKAALARLGGEVAFVALPARTANALTDATSLDGNGALEAMGIPAFAHAYGLKGSGIGVWLQEGGRPDATNPAINASKLKLLTFDPVDPVHATLTTTTLQNTAPLATVYYGHQPNGCHLLTSILLQTNPPIYLGSHSWNWGDTNTGVYGGCAGEWDDFVYTNRLAMFVPSGGDAVNHFTTTPGKAYNVVAVGGSDEDHNSIPDFSGYLNPETGAVKPDLVAPGTCIAIMPGYDCVSGVSIATPFAAGFASDMLGGSAFFRNQPQAVKAYMQAGATTDVEPGISKDGPGQIQFLHTWFARWGKTWNGPNGSHFNANGEILETRPLTAGQRYRIAISWLTPGSYVLANKKPSMQMQLTVSLGATTYSSSYFQSTSQWVDFVAPTTGNYTIKIKRTVNSGVGDVALTLTEGVVN